MIPVVVHFEKCAAWQLKSGGVWNSPYLASRLLTSTYPSLALTFLRLSFFSSVFSCATSVQDDQFDPSLLFLDAIAFYNNNV